MLEPDNTKKEYNTTDDLSYLVDGSKKSLKLAKATNPSNVPIKALNKINKIVNTIDLYNKNLSNTNSHLETTIMTIGETISKSIVQAEVIGTSIGIANAVVATGGYTPPACLSGALVGSVCLISGLEFIEQVGYCANKLSNNIIGEIKNSFDTLPAYTQEIIRECVREPVEQTLKTIHEFSAETIDSVVKVVGDILIDGWNKIQPDSTIIYCMDKEGKQIEINLNKYISTKIYSYCQASMGTLNTNLNYGMYSNNGIKKYSTSFENKFNEFGENFNSFQYNLKNHNFKKNTEKMENLTPYEQIVSKDKYQTQSILYKPNTSILNKTKINNLNIPEYKVSCHVSGSSSNSLGAVLGTGVVFAVQVCFVF